MTKDEIRQQMKRARSAIAPQKVRKWSCDAALMLTKTEEYKNAASIMLYYPIGNEVDTAYVAEAARGDGKTVLYPVTDEKSRKISPVCVGADTKFEAGGFKIPEPVGEVWDGAIDLIVVPGVAFDRTGARLGFGKGCYDEFLCRTSAVRVGLCYEIQLVDRLPTEAHDVQMDMIVTEKEIMKRR